MGRVSGGLCDPEKREPATCAPRLPPHVIYHPFSYENSKRYLICQTVELRDVFGIQPDVGGLHILLEMVETARARDGQHDR